MTRIGLVLAMLMALARPALAYPPLRVLDEGTLVSGTYFKLDFVGGGVSCVATASSSKWTCTIATGAGGVTAVTGTSPIVSSGGTTPALSCATCVSSLQATTGNVSMGGITVARSGGNINFVDVTRGDDNTKVEIEMLGTVAGGAGALTFYTAAGACDARLYRQNVSTLLWDNCAGGAGTLRGSVLTIDNAIQGAGGGRFLIYWPGIGASTILGDSKGADLASAATIAPTSGIHHVTGTTNVSTVTAPATTCNADGNAGCRVLFIADNAAGFQFVTGGNIALGATVLQNQAMELVYDGNTDLWYPVQ